MSRNEYCVLKYTFLAITLDKSFLNRNLIRIERDGRISESNIPDLSASPWEYQERVDNMPALETFQTMESNVYWFETSKQRCVAKQETGHALNFYVATKAVQQTDEIVLQANVFNEGKWKLYETHCHVSKNNHLVSRK